MDSLPGPFGDLLRIVEPAMPVSLTMVYF